MPNWCSNSISITGKKKAFDILAEKLKQIIAEDKPIMNHLLFDKDQDEKTWYEDNLKNLGTKWDFQQSDYPSIDIEPDGIHMSVQTAWSPPVKFLINLCKKFGVEGEIIYAEPGCDFAGKTIVHSDGAFADECYSYYEGLYRCDYDFWGEVSLDAESAYEYSTEDEFLERFSFLTDSEKEDVRELYRNAKANAETF